LDDLAEEAMGVSRKARRYRKQLSGDNYYGNKLAQLRAAATNAFADLTKGSVGDTSAIAELIEGVFSANTTHAQRLVSARELSHGLKTRWRQSKREATAPGNELFPLSLIAKTKRGYLMVIANQMNGCFRQGWYDSCAVMMRRLVEVVLIEAFEHQGVASKIKDAKGDYVQLSSLIDAALVEPKFTLTRSSKVELPRLRNLGHRSAHGRHFTAQAGDIAKVEDGVRVVVEEFLNHAGLL
jgi:hypothetical protein